MQSSDQLFIIAGFVLGILSLTVFTIVKEQVNHFKSSLDMRKQFKIEKEKVEKFKAEGGVHKWLNDVAVMMPNGKIEKTHVCEHTGYCPAIDGFLNIGKVRDIALMRKNQAEFEDYRDMSLVELSSTFGISKDKLVEIYTEVLDLKRKFHIKKMNEFKAEMQEKFGSNIKIVSSTNELNDAIKEVNNAKF